LVTEASAAAIRRGLTCLFWLVPLSADDRDYRPQLPGDLTEAVHGMLERLIGLAEQVCVAVALLDLLTQRLEEHQDADDRLGQHHLDQLTELPPVQLAGLLFELTAVDLLDRLAERFGGERGRSVFARQLG
jgi:hypothetical protein